MRFAKVCLVLFTVLLLSACGGGGGGGSDTAIDADAPTFSGGTTIESSTSVDSISVAGDSGTDTAVIVFNIQDAAGIPAPDGRRVDFALLIQPMGGEALLETEAHTVAGKVTATLRSGTTSGPVDIQASYYDEETGKTLKEVVRVTILGGISDETHLSISAEAPLSMDAHIFNLEKQIMVNLGDRYGNVVPDGTPVSFMTEGGTIGLSTGFDATTTSGVASATLRTANPTTPDLDGIDPVGNPGLCKVVAYTSGSESYQDLNGNGRYDGEEVDRFKTDSDMSEPYIDANDSGSYETGELYIDSNGDGMFTPANEIFDANTTIWTSMNITFSSGIALVLGDNKDGWELDCKQTKKFSFIVSDSYLNTPLDGTEYTIEVTSNDADIVSNPESPLTDLDGRSKTVNFTLTPNTETVPGNIEVTVTATLPDGTQVSDDYKGEISGICPINP